MTIRIKERSFLARLAAWRLGVDAVALTLGDTIHLHRAKATSLLRDEAWLRHELKHVEQFRRYGYLRFLFLYAVESCRKGYWANRFEVEARCAEGSVHCAGDPFHFSERPGFIMVSMHEELSLSVDPLDPS